MKHHPFRGCRPPLSTRLSTKGATNAPFPLGYQAVAAVGVEYKAPRIGAAAMIASMPPKLRSLAKPGQAYPVAASDRLRAETVALRACLTAGAKAGNLQW